MEGIKAPATVDNDQSPLPSKEALRKKYLALSAQAVVADPACYPDSAVLRNKLNIVDQDMLEAAEAAFAATAVQSIEIGAPPFDLA
ncbi:hypothetical protein [Xanthomonas oryzae]|uniref:hypothetical protein n=1 Tax=Xanthomonas oryzae TaxID=347 RepID=UPI001E34DF25|nr:hypothetical protein [Xanthomonas oryzae]UWI56157.1 hypothetical protein NO430_16330 [Xanthomonas oryzae pv. oryzae]